ncbi:hypothetical protein [Phytohabitans houttuyneae]|uniref:hypothetical protein n=1 Tax=Phytohabitans houttuyneae TaxID=1076126 RepID=UPI0031ED5F3E
MSRSPSGDQESTARVAKEQAANVGHTAAEGGGQVLRTAAEQGRQVAGEAGERARELYGVARDEVRGQVGGQQRRAAGGLRSVSGELRAMADEGGGSGPATELARRASGTIDQFAGWLEGREPGAVLDEVKRYARQHPGAFLAGAAVLGVLAGRLTRGLAADASADTGTGDDRPAGNGAVGVATVPPATGIPPADPIGYAEGRPADPIGYTGGRP